METEQLRMISEAVKFAPLTRQTYSDTTWSGDQYVNEALPVIMAKIKLIGEMPPQQKGEDIGVSVLHLRQKLFQFAEDSTLISDPEYREEYTDLLAHIDAHIAYNAISHGVGFQVTWQEATQKIFTYAQGNRLYDVFNAAKSKGEEDPSLAVGIDFIEQVVAEIID
jgi:hypothetical protein